MFQGLEHWFQKLFGSLSKEEKIILHYVLPIAETDAGKIMAAGLPFAKTIVADIISSGSLKGTPARDAAATQLKDTLVKQGVAGAEDVAMRTLNWIVETALGNLDATKTQT